MPLNPGDRIERYVIEALIGAGGMAEVYRAHDSRLERKVALKILHGDLTPPSEGASASAKKSGGASSRLLREARAVAALAHPNVVSIFDVGIVESPKELEGTTYLAMELVDGVSLRKVVGDESFGTSERLRWLVDVARALAAAHAKGLVHRDIKPENVMRRSDGRITVLDFGIAKRAAVPADATSSTEAVEIVTSSTTATAAGVAVGTPLYMAPEQLRAEELDGRADQFGWAVTAYELLTGHVPWNPTGGALAVVSQILSTTPRPVSELADVPPHVSAVIARALEKNRADRYPTMDAIVDALATPSMTMASAAVTAGNPLPNAPAAEPVVSPPPPRKRRASPLVAAAGVGVVLALALVGRKLFVAAGPLAPAGSSSSASSAPPECATARACIEAHGGEAWACRASDHRCVPLKSEDCTPLFDPKDLTADDTIWLGAMFPTKGPLAEAFGTMNVNGVDLARREVAQATRALDGQSGALRVPRLALVACDDSQEPMRAARHLVDDVGVPAIMGFRSGQELVDVAGALLIPRGVVSVASLTANPVITRVPQPASPRLVWRTTFSLDGVALGIARVVEEVLEPRAKAGVARVALVRGDSVGDQAFAETLYKNLRYNGKSATDNGHDYKEITLAAQPEASAIEHAADELAQLAPTFALVEVGGDASVALVAAVEKRWKTGPRPVYVLASDSTELFAPYLGKSVDRRRRLFAMHSLSNSTANARFVIRYNSAHTDQVTRTINPGVSYDAFYLLAYATFAQSRDAKGPVTGASIARAIARLTPPGRPIEVGPTNIFEALTALSAGEHIDLHGVESGLDFDLATGEAPSDFALLCPGVDREGSAQEDVESGVVFHAATRKISGALKCP